MAKKKVEGEKVCSCSECSALALAMIDGARRLGVSPGEARNAFQLAVQMIDLIRVTVVQAGLRDEGGPIEVVNAPGAKARKGMVN